MAEPVMQYYDANGKRVKEGAQSAVIQYLSDDPARPDAKGEKPAEEQVEEPVEEKAIEKPAANKARTSSAKK